MGGKPVIAWTIEAALACPEVGRVLVSTDDAEIAAVAKAHGAEVPFLRPPEVARDDTPDAPVYLHAVEWLAKHEGYEPELVTWLRPTSPLRTAADVSGALRLLAGSTATGLRSVCPAEHHPYWMKRLEGDRLLPFLPDVDIARYPRRQLLPPVYRLNGAVEVTRRAQVLRTGELYGSDVMAYVMPVERSVDLDTPIDLDLAELLITRGVT